MLGFFIAIISATAGHILLSRHDLRGLALWVVAIVILLLTLRRSQVQPELSGISRALGGPAPVERTLNQTTYRRLLRPAILSLVLVNAIVAFLAASDNTYRWYGVVAWLLATGLFLGVFWEGDPNRSLWQTLHAVRERLRPNWTTLTLIALILLGMWFRFWQLDELPSEMTSDHVEKLLDIHDLVNGQRPIYFVRNTGREPWQFYWTLMLIRLFDLDTKFFALKLGTALIGLLTLPGVYLLGRELFGPWVGLWATLFAAVASWPVILSRVGLRFPFAPAATAWSLLYLLRGLRDGRRNDFLLLGLWLGIGLHGYTAFRAMPLAVAVCWGLALLFRSPRLSADRSVLLRNALLTVLITGIIMIPLFRFTLEHPENVWRRSFSRVADPTQPMPDGPFITLLKNLVDLALMFHWKGDDVWVNTLTDAPVLDPLLGGLLVLGLVVALWRGVRLRDACAPLLVVAGALLLLPSALSLAYPIENPSVVRAGGAIPAVMVIAALPIGLAMERGTHEPEGAPGERRRSLWRARWHTAQRALLALCALALAVAVTAVNYSRYFDEYWNQYQRNALNTTEIASAIRGFIASGGDPSDAWIVAWPYWIDTRGVGIELGDPDWNNVILKSEELDEQAAMLASTPDGSGRPRFYVLHPEDRKTLEHLGALFPEGWSSLYASARRDRDFVLFFVPQIPAPGKTQDSQGLAGYGH